LTRSAASIATPTSQAPGQSRRGWMLWELWRRTAGQPDPADQEDRPQRCPPGEPAAERGISRMPAHGHRRPRHLVPRKLRRDTMHAVALRADDRARHSRTWLPRSATSWSRTCATTRSRRSGPLAVTSWSRRRTASSIRCPAPIRHRARPRNDVPRGTCRQLAPASSPPGLLPPLTRARPYQGPGCRGRAVGRRRGRPWRR
jgi:hypothetical protein